MKTKLREIFAKENLTLSDVQIENFKTYAELLLEWNEKINLTAITDDEGIAEKHFLDSVLPLTKVDVPRGTTLIDVGTGAGFPAIPMKIYRNDIEITLLDSLNKRINFLSEVSDTLELSAKCIHSRAEDGGKNPERREKFDIATARAVAPLPVLCEYCLPFVKVGGKFLAFKGPNENAEDAEKAVEILGGKICSTWNYSLPSGDNRRLIVIEKVKETPKKYPRDAGKIKKNPL
ncbi:MAG: 16S rRNA (guanine(527)-N(7))-methyltransferase RsmG [Oscillospiraceae bacterium]|nr:16S rRNA (guanine(527)-N(7))-methyltransferase RsmG [Oscillospiraceae bacterium]